MESVLTRTRVVLVETSHPGNIGATARAMKTMGLERLMLVRPTRFPSAEATARASGADDVLARAEVHPSLEEALHGCALVMGSSARERGIPWPTLSPEAGADKALQAGDEVALVFGREHSGLNNEELEVCHYLVKIPANPAYSSLNLAAAVQVMGYEWRRAWSRATPETATTSSAHVPETEKPADAADMAKFYAHLEQTLIDLAFLDPEKPRRLMHRLHRLFNRAQPNRSEYNILRGILTAAQTAVRENKK